MSKVVIQGNASGTGNFTIAAPNSDTNRTLTLPDEAGEVLVNDGTTLVVNYTNNRVGIGLNNPTAPLNVSTTSGTIARFAATTNTTALEINSPIANYVALKAMVNDGLIFSTNNNEKMRIDSSGKVAMGTSTPLAAELTVFHSGMAGIITKMTGTTATNAISFQNGNGQIGRIQVSGTTTSYITSSDYRLKENVVEITDGIDRVKLLNPSRFNFIADSDTTVDGFLAHEVQEVVPEAIAGAKDATKEEEYEVTPAVLDDDGNVVTEAVMGTRTVPDYQGIDQSKLVPLLTAALQEAITKIEALEARVTALENA